MSNVKFNSTKNSKQKYYIIRNKIFVFVFNIINLKHPCLIKT